MIELRTLGALELMTADGTTVSSVLAQPRRAALLCYLALASPRGFHRRDSLFALLWPEHDAEQARHALRQAIYFLRRALGPQVIVSRGDEEVALAADRVRCDVWEFEAAVRQGRTADALAQYQGELLAGFHVSNAPDFERWLEAQRTRLKQEAEEAAWTLAAARQSDGDTAGAVEAARSAVALAPTDEIALRRLVLLLESVGNRAAAVRAYETFTQKLWEEYELEPSAETQVLVARIRAATGERQSPVPGRADAPASSAREPIAAAGLQNAGGESGSHPVGTAAAPHIDAPSSRAARTRRLVAGAVLVTLLLAFAGILFRTQARHFTAPADSLAAGATAPTVIAVLPFAFQDDALANWGEGLMDLVAMELSGIPGIRAVDSRMVLARWREAVAAREAPALATALDVAKRTGGRYAVAGNVIADGSDLVLTAGVHEVAGRRMLGTARARGPADSIFALVDRLTLQIMRLMPGGERRELAQTDLARVNTTSLPALKAFLEGEVQFRRSQFESAANAYAKAVEADSTFALARYRLGWSRQWFWADFGGVASDPLAPAVGRFGDRLPPHEAAMFRAFQLREKDVRAARDLLEEEARRHPEDADTWYHLGEFYHHSGDEVPAPPGSADRALDRAIALDSTYSLPYFHRIEHAIRDRDTAGTERLLRTFARLAPDTRHLAQLRLLAGFVVGDSIARSRREAALDTLEFNRLFWLGLQFAQTRRWDLAEQAFRAAWDRGERRADAALPLFFTCLAQGKIREARRWLNDPFTQQSHKARMLNALAEVGAPIPAAELDAFLYLNAADSADAVERFYFGALAASRGRWEVAQGSLAQLRSRARSVGAADSSAAYFAEAMREGLEGYVAWRQGQRDDALRLLRNSQRRAHGGRGVNDLLRWWLARLLVELGRPREALPYFASLTGSWLPAKYHAAQLYEQAGMAQQAREAYALFLAPLPQADAVFHPMMQDARVALARLGYTAPVPASSDEVPATPQQ